MRTTIRADFTSKIDVEGLRAGGEEAIITADQCWQIANLVDGLGSVVAFPSHDEADEEFHGSCVPALPISILHDDIQKKIIKILAGNTDAISIVERTVEHGICASFTRNGHDRQYRVRFLYEMADNIDINLAVNLWKSFREKIGIDNDGPETDITTGQVSIAELEHALDRHDFIIRLAGASYVQICSRLKAMIAFAKSQDAVQIVWA